MTKRQATAFALRLEGHTYAQIAQQTLWSELSLRKYFSQKGKWHQEYDLWRQEAVKDIETETRIRIRRDMEHAMTVLEYALMLKNTFPGVSMRAAERILDMGGLTRNPPEPPKQTSEDLVEKLVQWYEKQTP